MTIKQLGLGSLAKAALASTIAIGLLGAAAQPAHAAPSGVISKCVTRTFSGTYQNGANWMAQTVCQPNEIAISAGGFCSPGASPTGAHMIGASTTSGTTDRQVWLWCSQTTQAIWYGMCCDSLE